MCNNSLPPNGSNRFQPRQPSNSSGNNNGETPFTKILRSIMIWGALFAAVIIVYVLVNGGKTQTFPISYTKYVDFLNENAIQSAKIYKSQLNDFEFHGTLKEEKTIMIDGRAIAVKHFTTKLGVLDSKTEELWATKGISWTYEESDSTFWSFVMSFLPWVALIGVYIFVMRKMSNGGAGGGSRGIFSFGKSRARLVNEHGANRKTFADVAGVEEAKEELREIIEFLREPLKFQRLGGKIPRGVLLLGPPGTGKTLLARAVAGEANVPFFSISGADFVEMFVGVGASRVRDLFDNAKKSAPCLIFIDEIDAVGRHRGAGLGGGHDEREQTLNQLLVEMDGFENNGGIIVIAATNRPDVLDPALLRPGRFDRQVVVDRPDVKGREQILKVHVKNVPLDPNINLENIARGTPGLSGADLANLVNEAALYAARRNSNFVQNEDFENAKDKILMGVERKSMVISEKEKEITAYHEMGHALAGKFLPHSDPVHKVTIIPRGRALGVTSYLPTEDSHTYSKDYIESRIITLLAGRAAEMIVFNQLTTGAGNDLERASALARKMVCEWGMSDAVGPVTFAHKQEEVFLGREIAQPRDHSEETARLIDNEVRKILINSMHGAEKLLRDNIDLLHKTSKVLLERETIDGEELDKIIAGIELPPRPPKNGVASHTTTSVASN
ncbi:MAG: ATP-dependent zinc metalloprotease FtsH [Candidatus Kapabacteria bacterium]|nr:ATP-dependent zinc metalloprotease FtsH [Candidatus Kapabacteria bacterium]